jgi:hypothetical protein
LLPVTFSTEAEMTVAQWCGGGGSINNVDGIDIPVLDMM